jgi:phosphoserine phosphatase
MDQCYLVPELPYGSKMKAYLFDLDGTLAASEVLKARELRGLGH